MVAESTLSQRIQDASKSFHQDGFAVVEQFLSDDEVEALRKESLRLTVEESLKECHKAQIFDNDYNVKSQYYLGSGERIRYFFEKDAFNLETEELVGPIEGSIAKIAHAVHALNPIFKDVSTSPKVQETFKAIGFNDPRILQSMVIFKNPKVGGEYIPHQDGSYLTTDPPEHVAGIWLALDDATEENGCLQFIAGSHKWPLKRRFFRAKTARPDGAFLEWDNPPEYYEDHTFVKVPVKRGDMILIHGLVIHRSDANNSSKPRWIYTFHAYDKSKSQYLKDCWLQPEKTNTFIPVQAN